MMWFFFILGILILGLLLLWIIHAKRRKFSEHDRKLFKAKWVEILQLKFRNPKEALMEADKLLDWALAKKGYSGTLSEKLKRTKRLFSDLDGLWNAHRKRNELVHEVESSVSPKEAGRFLSSYNSAFRDLGL